MRDGMDLNYSPIGLLDYSIPPFHHSTIPPIPGQQIPRLTLIQSNMPAILPGIHKLVGGIQHHKRWYLQKDTGECGRQITHEMVAEPISRVCADHLVITAPVTARMLKGSSWSGRNAATSFAVALLPPTLMEFSSPPWRARLPSSGEQANTGTSVRGSVAKPCDDVVWRSAPACAGFAPAGSGVGHRRFANWEPRPRSLVSGGWGERTKTGMENGTPQLACQSCHVIGRADNAVV